VLKELLHLLYLSNQAERLLKQELEVTSIKIEEVTASLSKILEDINAVLDNNNVDQDYNA